MAVHALAALQHLPLGTHVSVSGTVTLPLTWLGARTFYIGDDSGGIRAYIPRYPSYQNKEDALHTLNAHVRLEGKLTTYKGERQITVEKWYPIISTSARVRIPTPTVLDEGQDVVGTLVTTRGIVSRRYVRSFLLKKGQSYLRVYVPRKAQVSMSTIQVGKMYMISGVLTRWKGKPQLVVRTKADISLAQRVFLTLCRLSVEEKDRQSTRIPACYTAILTVSRQRVFIV